VQAKDLSAAFRTKVWPIHEVRLQKVTRGSETSSNDNAESAS
jgi:hypothetical protein